MSVAMQPDEIEDTEAPMVVRKSRNALSYSAWVSNCSCDACVASASRYEKGDASI